MNLDAAGHEIEPALTVAENYGLPAKNSGDVSYGRQSHMTRRVHRCTHQARKNPAH